MLKIYVYILPSFQNDRSKEFHLTSSIINNIAVNAAFDEMELPVAVERATIIFIQ